ncbi:MAG TPA: hypothetical protein VMD56_01490 [Steroidobacteraceae bacterium]|nr:hypothetical protein [Steroidobacteraceae bacterium]
MGATRGNQLRTTSARLASFGLEDGPPASLSTDPRPGRSGGAETLHVLTTLEEVRTATETVAASGQRLISIMTPDLEPDIYDQAPILDIIKRFVLGHSFAKVRVLVRDQPRLVSGANHFVAMAHRLTSYLEIRVRSAQYQALAAAYCIADDRAIVYRLRADRAEGIAGFNNPPIARQFLQEFDAVWQASAAEPREVRVARR